MSRNQRVGTLPWNCATLVWQRRRQFYAVLILWVPVYAGALLLVIDGRAALRSAFVELLGAGSTIAEYRWVGLASEAVCDAGLVLLESGLVVLLLRRLIGRDRVPPGGSGFLRAFWPIAALSLAIELAFSTAFQFVRTANWLANSEAEGALQGLSAIALGVAYVWLYARFCLVFPYAAIGEGWRARQSWRQTSTIRIRLSAMLAVIFFADVLLSTVIWQLSAAPVPAMAWYLGWSPYVAGAIMISIKNAVTFTIFLGLVVVAFGRLSGRWVAGVRGGPRSPEETAGVFD